MRHDNRTPLTPGEAEGVRRILENPEPPTERLREAMRDYLEGEKGEGEMGKKPDFVFNTPSPQGEWRAIALQNLRCAAHAARLGGIYLPELLYLLGTVWCAQSHEGGPVGEGNAGETPETLEEWRKSVEQ